MGNNGYFFSPPEISIPAEFLRYGHYPSWWDTVMTIREPLVQFPVVAKSPLRKYKGLEGVFPIFSPIAHQKSTMQRQVICSQF